MTINQRRIYTLPNCRSEGFRRPYECDNCAAVFTIPEGSEVVSHSIQVQDNLRAFQDTYSRLATHTVCYRCLPNWTDPLEADGFDLSEIAIEGLPYTIPKTAMEFRARLAGWKCFHLGDWTFEDLRLRPQDYAYLRVNRMAVIEVNEFPRPLFRLRLEIRKLKKVFFAKINASPETSHEEMLVAANKTEEDIRERHREVVAEISLD